MKSIAVIGIACRFPGANNKDEYWQLLKTAKDAITEIPRDRWDVDALYAERPGTLGKINSRCGGFINDVDKFDAEFFAVNEREAISMDPQQRLLLEISWAALEDAGIAVERLAGSKTGVYIGSASFDYNKIVNKDFTILDGYIGPGTAICALANRISYVFNLCGPSMTIDTACSSSLVALHQACQSLQQGETNLAISGSINLILSPESSLTFAQAGMLADRCKTFDKDASGYVRAEGCAALVLKRHDDAVHDNDRIYAVIKGSAVNQDGLSNGITAPNSLAQRAVIQQALADANIHAEKISYVETHGTGTRLGDPIEISALKAVLMNDRELTNRCALGAVKTNIGHTEALAGFAGLIKVILAMQHKQIPANLHLTTINPYVDSLLKNTSFYFPQTLTPWEVAPDLRIAGVSSFGFGGTNAHVIVEEYQEKTKTQNKLPQLFVLSAKNERALRDLISNYVAFLEKNPKISLNDVCYTAAVGRNHFKERFSCVVASVGELAAQLKNYLNGADHEIMLSQENSSNPDATIQFHFKEIATDFKPAEIYSEQTIFKETFAQCAAILKQSAIVCDEIFYHKAHDDQLTQQQQSIKNFVYQYAVAKVWMRWGVKPHTIIGEGAAEFVAATLAGVISLEAACNLLINGEKELSSVQWQQPKINLLAPSIEAILSGEVSNFTEMLSSKHSAKTDLLTSCNNNFLLTFKAIEKSAANKSNVLMSSWQDILCILKDIYQQGLALQWQTFYENQPVRRISLPTYPFQGKRYWVDDSVHRLQIEKAKTEKNIANEITDTDDKFTKNYIENTSVKKTQHKASSIDVNPYLFQVNWEKTEVIDGVQAAMKPENVLIVFSKSTIKLKDKLHAIHQDSNIVTIELGDITKKYSANNICVDCYDPNAFVDSLKSFKNIGLIYFLASADYYDTLDTDATKCFYQTELFGLFDLVKHHQEITKKHCMLKLVTFNACDVNNKEISTHHAMLMGFAKTASVELNALDLQHIDCENITTLSDASLKVLAQSLKNESTNIRQSSIAFRDGVRYERSIIPADMQATNISFRQNGIYLIVGGFGNVGLTLCSYLAQNYQARLIIWGRSILSKEGKRLLHVLKSIGSDVIYQSVDIADARQVQTALEVAEKKFGGIHGVIHSGVVLNDKTIFSTSKKDFDAVFNVKVTGTLVLAKKILDKPLDFFAVFSSVVAIMGNAGQANYAAACAFQDAFVTAYQSRVQYPVKTINWSYWEDSDNDEQNLTEKMRAYGIHPLSAQEGMQLLEAIIASNAGQLLALKLDNQAKEKLGIKLSNVVNIEDAVKTLVVKDSNENLLNNLLHIVEDVTKVPRDKIALDDQWQNLGVDSILAMEMLTKIATKFGVRLFPNELEQHDTLQKLANFLLQEAQPISSPASTPKNPVASINKDQPSMIYLLSAPRSGSTLLRVMLMGHSQLFAPPELHLLPYQSLKDRQMDLARTQRNYLAEGLIETLCELNQLSVNEARLLLNEWEKKGKTVAEIYAYLQQQTQGKYLIDKSPSYAMDLRCLERAEIITPNAFYIYLVRHPIAMMESFVRNRFDKLLNLNKDAWATAEEIWTTCNNNITKFLTNIPAERQCTIDYESLVTKPETVLKNICSSLNIPFQQALLQPYQGKRMTKGLNEGSLSIGDPNFLQHKTIDDSLANVWQDHGERIASLSTSTIQLARQYHYLQDQTVLPLLPAQQLFLAKHAADPTWYIHYDVEFTESHFDLERFKTAVNVVCESHLMFRVAFQYKKNQWVMKEKSYQPIMMDEKDLSELSPECQQAEIAALRREAQQLLDIANDSLLAIRLAKRDQNRYQMMMVIHHVISDGYSVSQLLRQIFERYKNPKKSLTTDDLLYQQYVEEVKIIQNSSEFENYRKVQSIQFDDVKNYCFTNFSKGPNDIASERELLESINLMELNCYELDSASIYSTLTIALYKTLFAWNRQDNAVVAHRLHRRNINATTNYYELIGYFAGDVPIKLSNDSFSAMQQSFKKIMQELPWGGLGYELLVNAGKLPPTENLAAVRLNYQPIIAAHFDPALAINQSISLYEPSVATRDYLLDLIVRYYENTKSFDIRIRYSTNFHDEKTIRNFTETWFHNLYQQIKDNRPLQKVIIQ